MDALADGSTLSGSAAITLIGEGEPTVGEGVSTVGEFTVALQCARHFDDQTWFLAGAVEESSGDGLEVGSWVAVTLRHSRSISGGNRKEPGMTACSSSGTFRTLSLKVQKCSGQSR